MRELPEENDGKQQNCPPLQAPSRRRSASPASVKSFRCRDTRGCDLPRIATSSVTVSSPSARRQSSRRRVISAAAANGWIDRRSAVLESLTSIRRARADVVLTYWAAEAAAWLS